ncbi:MAG: hypothetical protein LBT19_00520 [Candidatus Nomurabacteria bacterium]|jgi:hypothetical protein|nr:hypothetical protein [Candidatus Nomurabacteria bacterium]
MEKKLKAYTDFIKAASSHPTPEIATYHATMLRQFQHERFIHLIITMFFALFLIIFFIFTSVLFLTLSPSLWSNIFCYSSATITLILFATTLFYIHHYYKLENGVQQLEALTPKIHKIT